MIPTTVKSTKLGVAAQGRLRYKFPKVSLDLEFQRFETSGSGLLAGAQSNIVSLSLSRPLSRVWSHSSTADFRPIAWCSRCPSSN